jgi:hypothetical protein
MWPVTGIRNSEQSMVTLTEYPDLHSALDGLDQRVRVLFEPLSPQERTPRVSLADFQHVDDAVWIFGSAHYNPVMNFYREDTDTVITLPTEQNKGVLWPHQVLVAALYDRLVKQWR